MSNNKVKYQRVIQWVSALVLLFFIGGCGVYSPFHASLIKEPSIRQESALPLEEEVQLSHEAVAQFYDSIQLVEYQQFYDSSELVMQTEWDSVMRVMADSVGVDRIVNALADSIVAYAMEYMHAPYYLGGNGPKAFDCSGFTKYVFRKFGYSLKRTVPGQLSDGWKIIDNQDELRRGDLAFFGGRTAPNQMGHVAIVVDNDPKAHSFTFIHATVKKGIIISESNEKYYRTRYMTACRILPE